MYKALKQKYILKSEGKEEEEGWENHAEESTVGLHKYMEEKIV